MEFRFKAYSAVLVVGIALATLLVSFLPVRYPIATTPHTASTQEHIASQTYVTQTFTSDTDNLSEIRVFLDTRTVRAEDIQFNIHKGEVTGSLIHTGTATPPLLGNMYRFSFPAIQDSKDVTYTFSLALKENASTETLPIHLHATTDSSHGPTHIAHAMDDHTIYTDRDIVFAAYAHVIARDALILRATQTIDSVRDAWTHSHEDIALWIRSFLTAALLIFFLAIIHPRIWKRLTKQMQPRHTAYILLTFIFIGAVIYRLSYAIHLPITHDEGNYLYDAYLLQSGSLAGGDGYVKTPLTIAWISLWQFILGNTVLAGRMASVVASALMVFPLYILAKHLWSSLHITQSWLGKHAIQVREDWGVRIGIIVAVLWAFIGTSAASGAYAHTQSLALLLATSGLALFVSSMRIPEPFITSSGRYVVSGILLALAVISRRTTAIVILLPLGMTMLEYPTWGKRIRRISSVYIAIFISLALFLFYAAYMYGTTGVLEALGIHSARDALAHMPTYGETMKQIAPVFRESLPIIFFALAGMGIFGEYFMRTYTARMRTVKMAWILPWILYAWIWISFLHYEHPHFHGYGMQFLFLVYALFLVLYTCIPRTHESQQKGARMYFFTALAILLLWFAGTGALYAAWIRFDSHYLIEFMPPLVLLGGFGAVAMLYELVYTSRSRVWFTRPLALLFCIAVGWSTALSHYLSYTFEHTGEFTQEAAQSAAAWAHTHIPHEEPIFTASPLIPYLSGHDTPLTISHARWYLYDFIRERPERLETFLPATDDIIREFQHAQWLLLDNQTQLVFLDTHPQIQNDFEKNWKEVVRMGNNNNLLRFYVRYNTP